jgi:hypothetical protein
MEVQHMTPTMFQPMKANSTFLVIVGTGRVEERRGARPTGSRSFPLPADQTGRADFPHPAFRLDFTTRLTNETSPGLDAVEQRPTGRSPGSFFALRYSLI